MMTGIVLYLGVAVFDYKVEKSTQKVTNTVYFSKNKNKSIVILRVPNELW